MACVGCICYFIEITDPDAKDSNTGGTQILQTLMKSLSLSGNGFKPSLLPPHSAFGKTGHGLISKHCKCSN